jgi:hypothetical protein
MVTWTMGNVTIDNGTMGQSDSGTIGKGTIDQ